ncbi:HNH endonuclease [Larkinella bovis]|uniref:HNH endonuclease n=1 Tax=Larkinella bovis TaxID=683041 RepID=A0ABW0IH73_9BACT
MRKIERPGFNVRTVFEQCISNMANQELRTELTDSLDKIERSEEDFNEKKETNEIYLIKRNVEISETANTDVLVKIYTERLVNKKNNARRYYDQILLSAPKGKCPLCNQRIADTLDHYLPKTLYPLLSVTPINLIPACSVCNKGKLIDYPLNSEQESLHPYYDNIENEEWLKCEVLEVNPIIFKYSVQSPDCWSELLKERVMNHFNSFKLNTLYVIHAIEEFANIKFQIEKLFNNGGQQLLKDHLSDCYESRKIIDRNSWQTAFYKALFDNDDFCRGNFIGNSY